MPDLRSILAKQGRHKMGDGQADMIVVGALDLSGRFQGVMRVSGNV
jgi:hypothetical protein